MHIISAKDLTKTFQVSSKRPGIKGTLSHFVNRKTSSFYAIENLDLEIDSGEVVGFIGPNGAGKTTTLKILCGLIHPTTGSVRVMGHVPYRRNHNFLNEITLVMGQKQQLLWDLPPIDSLKVNAAVYGIDDSVANKRISELSEMLQLKDELFRPVRKLSLGQRMKAELLASLIHRPRILFLDEPTLGLDINSQIRVREFLSQYNQTYNATILLTSHYMGDITSLCQRVVIIDHGKIFYDGSLSKLSQELTPYKFLRIEVDSPIHQDKLELYGELVNSSETSYTLRIKRNSLPKTLYKLLDEFNIKDLEVREPPIEDVVADLFKIKGSK